MVSAPLQHQIPYELLYGHPPDYTSLKVFGCLGYASTILANRTKFDPRADRCVFLGYKSGTKGFILLILATQQIVVSRNVVFHEHILPYHHDASPEEESDFSSTHSEIVQETVLPSTDSETVLVPSIDIG